MARASFEVAAAVAAILALTLAGAAAPAKRDHTQCSKYPRGKVTKMECLLRAMKRAPVGNATVRCSEVESDCLFNSRIYFPGDPDMPCVRLGSPCKLQDGSDGMVRASLDYWRWEGRLVGECAPPPRCNDTYVKVRRRWFSPKERCVQTGQLLCACARLEPRRPIRPFPDFDCHCDGEPTLQPAPFGGYECVHTCSGTCSPENGLDDGRCAFPPLDVDESADVYTTHQYEQPRQNVITSSGHPMGTPPPKSKGRKYKPWHAVGSRLVHRYLPWNSYATT